MRSVWKTMVLGLGLLFALQPIAGFAQNSDGLSQAKDTMFKKQQEDLVPPSLRLDENAEAPKEEEDPNKKHYWWYYDFRNSNMLCLTPQEAARKYLADMHRRKECTEKDRVKQRIN